MIVVPDFDLELIARYDLSGPRYTSYPTAVYFNEDFDVNSYRSHVAMSNEEPMPKPLSLYFHIPFCSALCFFCACNKIVTKDKTQAVTYLKQLFQELTMQAALFDNDRVVQQLHLGGGTPTFLDSLQLERLFSEVRREFQLVEKDKGDFSIEIDPRTVDAGTIEQLSEIGFNRISMGIQDFDIRVQKAVHRIQPEEQTIEVIEAAKQHGMKSINVDLMYGLPFQSQQSFQHTLERVIGLEVDRICLFNYAHLPEMFQPQKRIVAADLPGPAVKLDILSYSVNRLIEAGYQYIGMDHFAKPDDALSLAQNNGTLHRNFQGYTTHADCDLVGIGITSIGQIGDSYAQNAKTLEAYYQLLDENQLPVTRGIALDYDDIVRRNLIEQLMCFGVVYKSKFKDEFAIDFDRYFLTEQEDLLTLESDGLIEQTPDFIRVTPKGRFLVRNICMVFDAYLRNSNGGQKRYSRMI